MGGNRGDPILFFFSSRRRHTRSDRDWSSDVCSSDLFDRRQDPRGRVYYWMGGSIVDTENDDGTDVAALKKNKISITPVHFDLTNYAIMHLLEE